MGRNKNKENKKETRKRNTERMVEIEEYLSRECVSSNDASAANENSSEEEISTLAPPTKAQRDAIMEDLVRLSDQYIEEMPEM